MKISENLTILCWIRKNAPGTNGKKPLYCRITLNGVRCEISLGIYVDEKSFNKTSGFMKGSSIDAQQANSKLEETRSKLRLIYGELSKSEDPVTAQMLRDAYLGKCQKEHQRTLLGAIKWHNDFFTEKVRTGSRASATLAKFKITESTVKAFIKWNYKTTDLPLASIKPSFADDFDHYMVLPGYYCPAGRHRD